MFRIRKEQVDAYRTAVFEAFLDRAVAHLRTALGEEVAPFTDEQLRNRVRSCVRRAARYGLTSEYEVICFTDVTYLLGEHFDTNPVHEWTQLVLGDRGKAPPERARLLLEAACVLHEDQQRQG